MSRIRTQARLSSDADAETVEIDVHASFAHGIDLDDEDMVTAALAVNHVMLLDLVRGQLIERGVDPKRHTVEILDARLVADDAPAPRAALSVVPEGWTVTDVEVLETTTYTVTVAHPVGATGAEIAAVGYDDYRQALHPEAQFIHVVGADEVTVAGESQESDPPWPSWAAHRPAVANGAEPSPTAHG